MKASTHTFEVAQPETTHRFLLDPAAYPGCPPCVQLKETHISWVYLTDRFAFKQKKPVRFDFLDFSTLPLRKEACQQELALNRRLSPDIYLGVVPVRRQASGHLVLNGEGDVVEWLVKMKRLDETKALDQVLLAGQRPDVAGIAKTLVAFYAAQPPAVVLADQFRSTLRDHVLGNLNTLLPLSPAGARGLLQFATASQLRYLTLAAEHFDRRVCDGRVVDGHGDLRPEHIYVTAGRPHIIDCIEFNAEYRKNDILDEFAFLAVECERLGQAWVGRAILEAYLQESGDCPPERHADFYMSYRACVRAKVAALSSHANGGLPGQTLFDDYLRLAQAHAERLGPKLVVLVGGMMGSGKSTLAETLSRPLAAELIQTDAVRERIWGATVGTAYAQGKYSEAGRRQVYDAMRKEMTAALTRSPTVILDGTFSKLALRHAMIANAKELGAQVLQVQCVCSKTQALDRIARRQASETSKSQARPELYDPAAADYEPPDDGDLITVETTQSISEEVLRVLARVKEQTQE